MKACKKCEEEKSLEEFSFHKHCSNNRENICKACKVKISYAWRKKYPDRNLNWTNARNRTRKLAFIERFGNVCFDCKQSFPPCVYDFHHLDPKEKNVNPSRAYGSPKWEKELDKCIMICANCHRIRTFGRKET